jgi:hypothetical protein
MQWRAVFCDEADYERWLKSVLEAERQNLQSQVAPRYSRTPAPANADAWKEKEGDAA